MRVLPVVLALFFSTPALAAKYAGPQKARLEADGVVEVPLYQGLSTGDGGYYVLAMVGEEPLFLEVTTGTNELVLSERALTRIGAKIRGDETMRYRIASVPDVQLGGATITGARVALPGEGLDDAEKDNAAVQPTVDGVLGLGLVGEGGFALLPSQGVLRLAADGGGAQLLSMVSASPMPYTETTYARRRLFEGPPVEVQPATHIVPVSWSGVSVPTVLASGDVTLMAREQTEKPDWYTVKGYALPEPVALPAAPTLRVGDLTLETREVSVGGRAETVGVARIGFGPPVVLAEGALSQAGQSVLYAMDIAADGASDQIALKPADTVKLADYAPIREAYLRKKLDPPVAEGAEPPTDDEKAKLRKKGLAGLGSFLAQQGRIEEALEARAELTRLEGDKCENWHALGRSQLLSGRLDEAVVSFTKAMDLYDPWSKLPLGERREIEEAYAEAQADGEPWDGQVPQGSACFTSASFLVRTQIAAGNPQAVADLYPARLDLDVSLPEGAGNAALLLGDTEAAEAAYRQALAMIPTAEESARAGLFFALQRRDFDLATTQIEKTLFVDDDAGRDPELLRRYAEAIRQKEGAAASVKRLQAYVEKIPQSATIRTQLAREQLAAGDTAGAAASMDASEALLRHVLVRFPRDAEARARLADLLLLRQKADEARTLAEEATKLDPYLGFGWLVLSKVEAAAGDTAKTAEYRRRAIIAGGESPAYALLALE